MQDMTMIQQGSMRDLAIQSSKNFKKSWIDLGRVLYSIWRDKTYKEWGYQDFDKYVTKEIGIRKATSLKLLKSYYFLEKEEPTYLDKEYAENAEATEIPSYEAVDVLRQAKDKNINHEDYQSLKEKVFLKGKDSKEVRKDLTLLMRQREELDPKEAWQKRKESNIKRFIGTLKSLKREMEDSKTLPAEISREVNDLIAKLEDQI
ncbi:MAG: hypothetical protein PHY73_01410 [Candidatus Omnitrophica bacterium]|nr:hypothetical protein [Candidatus Omnitrophota bacterium]